VSRPRRPRKVQSGASRPELNGAAWKRTRAAVRRRDRDICVGCGATEKLSVHHLLPARLGGDDSMANLVTLCSRCHAGAEAKMRRRDGGITEDPRVWLVDVEPGQMRGPFSREW
jgi:5-methylcytosine-specific restriction endonuclease McrA